MISTRFRIASSAQAEATSAQVTKESLNSSQCTIRWPTILSTWRMHKPTVFGKQGLMRKPFIGSVRSPLIEAHTEQTSQVINALKARRSLLMCQEKLLVKGSMSNFFNSAVLQYNGKTYCKEGSLD